MQIRFRCRHCKKSLAVKQELAGKKAKCPVCKQPIVIPAPVTHPADVEDLAMAALADEPAAQEAAPQSIDFECEWCSEPISMALDMAGKREPCPSCKRIVRVPTPKNKKENWREITQKGPSGAAINQQQKLEGEWGTETAAGRVSRESMEEADAFIVPDEPFSLSKWLKRGAVAVVAIAILVAAVYGFNRQQRANDQKGSIETVHACLKEAAESKDAKSQLPAEWVAEIQRGLGEYYSRKTGKGMLEKARNHFNEAWGSIKDPRYSKPSFDRDLLLLRVAENMVVLGGTEEEDKDKIKIFWKDMPDKLSPALRKMSMDDARARGLRILAAKLKQAKQDATTISVISRLSVASDAKEQSKSLIYAQMLATLVEQKQESLAMARVPMPKTGEVIADIAPRLGYGEGFARAGQFNEARRFINEPGPDSLHSLRTALAIAEVALAANAADEAKQALDKALEIAGTRRWYAPDWDFVQLADLLAQTGDMAKSDVAKGKLTKGSEAMAWAEFAQFRVKLKELKSSKADPQMVQQIENANSLPRMLAWEEISRHNTKHGYRDAMKPALELPDDPRSKSFIHLGFALGEQDRE